ncbi:MAG: NAD-dependent epimerase/dehydratase family protein [Kordiimonadaceae bacterium]|jgi:nucleoside-diphosphate-sugar epimerase|nr:NAD-dependent epimerase/dehydratase family protein [Kordiimonadaceae bacterium]
MSKQRIALVTGGTGFIGVNLIKRLILSGWIVHLIVRQKSDLNVLKGSIKNITVHKTDGHTSSIVKIIAKSKPIIVFHLASLFLSGHMPRDIVPLINSNVKFSTQLLEAMNESGIKNIVNTGTSWQHFENNAGSPVNLYAATKQAFESILQYYIEANFFKVITLKLFDTYGPDDPRPKLFHLLEKISKTQEPLAMSPGEQLIDIVHVDDVINAFMIAAERLLTLQVTNHDRYAVSSGDPISLKKLVSIYEKETNIKLSIQWGGRPYRDREVMTSWSRGEIMPGWAPKVSLSNGIKQMNCSK